jgi:outer membrane receptor protein involved in Fe transport
MNRYIISVVMILIFAIFTLKTNSQQTGSIMGYVTDRYTQAFLGGVSVKVIGTELGTVTKDDGFFDIENIPIGTYEIEFTGISYQYYVVSNVVILPGKTMMLDIQIEGITTDEIVVESSRFQKPNDASTSFKSLTFEELRRSPGGFEDIGRIVQTLPGVAIGSDGRNDINVRGGSPSENLFVYDGFQANNINHFGSQGTTGGPISIINLDFVKEVNFLTGGFSVKYGDRLSSVVDIKLRDGNMDKFSGKINLSGTGFGANLEGPIPSKNKGSWIVSARRSYLDLIFNAAGFSFVPEYTDFQARLHYHLSENNFLTFSSFGAIDKVRFNNSTEKNKQDNERILTNNQQSYSSGIGLKTLLTKNSFSNISVSRNFTNYFFSKRDLSFNETFRNNSKESDILLKAEYSLKAGNAAYINLGTGGQTIKLNYDILKSADTLDYIDPVTGNRIVVPEVKVNENNTTYKAFAYAELIHNFLKRFKLTAGLRYDYFDLINHKNYISPRASLTASITPKMSINLAFGIFYQSPSYIWLAAEKDNLNLKNIRADHYVAGIEYLLDESTRLTLELFYKDYRNYPVSTVRPYQILANNSGFETENSFGLETLKSAGTGKSKGIELFLQKTLTRSLYGTISFSFSDVKYRAFDGIERRSDFDNRYIFNISGGYKLGISWEFSAKFRLAGGRPFSPINSQDGTIDYENYNSNTLPLYHRVDIRAEKRWYFNKWTLTTYADIQNVYNRKNISAFRWDKYNKVIVTDKNIGILPSIGISAEF